jgi:hypothetical protein
MKTQRNDSTKDDLPEYVERSIFIDWILHFKELGCTMTEPTFHAQLRYLQKAHQNGHDVNAMLEKAIAHGWKSFYFEGTHGKPKVNG